MAGYADPAWEQIPAISLVFSVSAARKREWPGRWQNQKKRVARSLARSLARSAVLAVASRGAMLDLDVVLALSI